MKDCECRDGIKRVRDNFINSFKIIFIILLDIIFYDIIESNYKICFYFKKKIKHIPFNKIKLSMKLGIKNN